MGRMRTRKFETPKCFALNRLFLKERACACACAEGEGGSFAVQPTIVPFSERRERPAIKSVVFLLLLSPTSFIRRARAPAPHPLLSASSEGCGTPAERRAPCYQGAGAGFVDPSPVGKYHQRSNLSRGRKDGRTRSPNTRPLPTLPSGSSHETCELELSFLAFVCARFFWRTCARVKERRA